MEERRKNSAAHGQMESLRRQPLDSPGLWLSMYRDYRRYRSMGAGRFTTIVLTQGFAATAIYRISRHLLLSTSERPAVYRVLRAAAALAQMGVELTAGISLLPESEIGAGLYIGHYGGIVIGRNCRLGRNCNVSQGVSIGVGGRGAKRGSPIVGDRVYFGPNAIVFGDIVIGADSAIGAGAIVTRSFPRASNILGNPARLVSAQGSFDFITYDGMATDPQRMVALARESAGPRPLGAVVQLAAAE